MGKILFTHSYFYKYDPKQWSNRTPYPPIGTLYAAAIMRSSGYDLSLWDSNLKSDHTQIKHTIEKEQPKYFVCYDDGFNYLTKMCLTNMREAAFDMYAYAKEIGALVIVSSSDSTDRYQSYHDNGADIVVHGEGEQTLIELIQSIETNSKDLSDIDGISFINENGKVVRNKSRRNLSNLDELLMPAWDLVDIDSYREIWEEGGKQFTLNIATTRGCPYQCNWCAKPIYGQRYNSRSPQNVLNEIQFLIENYNVNRFWMCDDIFGLKPKWVNEFSDLIEKEDIRFSFYAQSRADLLLKEDNINALHRAGLEEVWIGAESGSQKILDAMDKGTTVEQITESTIKLKEVGIKPCFFIQFGYLGETKKDIQMTISLIKKLKPHNIGVSVSYPLPGTKFYDRVKKELGEKENWSDSDELAMMFKGTFNTSFYRVLHRLVHVEFRTIKGLESLMKLEVTQGKQIFRLGYYIPLLLLKRIQLSFLNNKV